MEVEEDREANRFLGRSKAVSQKLLIWVSG
jgi:hypothetical protein